MFGSADRAVEADKVLNKLIIHDHYVDGFLDRTLDTSNLAVPFSSSNAVASAEVRHVCAKLRNASPRGARTPSGAALAAETRSQRARA